MVSISFGTDLNARNMSVHRNLLACVFLDSIAECTLLNIQRIQYCRNRLYGGKKLIVPHHPVSEAHDIFSIPEWKNKQPYKCKDPRLLKPKALCTRVFSLVKLSNIMIASMARLRKERSHVQERTITCTYVIHNK
jgi:hypothetical protein